MTASVAAKRAFVVVHVEDWELAPPQDAHRDPRFVGEYGRFCPDYRGWTQRACGNCVGIFGVLDVLDVLDRHGVRASFAVNSSIALKHRAGLAQ